MDLRTQNKIKLVICNLKEAGVLKFLFHPLLLIITTPVSFIKTLYNCRILLVEKSWGDFNRFHPLNAFNSLTYWTQAKAIELYGKTGMAPNIGQGNYKLSNWLNITALSHFAYWKGSDILLIGSFAIWLFSWFLFVDSVDLIWIIIVIFFASFSTMMYMNIFIMQNYNVLGWAFFPSGLYSLISEDYMFLAFSWLLVSFSSFTVTILAAYLTVLYAFAEYSWNPFIAFLPAGLKLLTHLYPLFVTLNIKKGMTDTAKSIGLISESKYKRNFPKFLSMQDIYPLLLLVQFVIVCIFFDVAGIELIYGSLLIFIINQSKLRFLDIQSLHFLVLSVSTLILINNHHLELLISFLILSNPMPIMINSSVVSITNVPVLKPFRIKPYIDEMNCLFKEVNEGEKILIACNNPRGRYDHIYDGYQANYELPIYSTMDKKIHFFPDWWSIYDLNSKDDPEYWGRLPEEVITNLNRIDANLVLIYQDNDDMLDSVWAKKGFSVVSEYDWKKNDELSGYENFKQPHWWLLRYKAF